MTNITDDVSNESDGYHTFAELYEHRHSLCLALMKTLPQASWFSKRHEDGELCFGDGEWFIVGVDLPNGAITYHLPIRLWDMARETGAKELEMGKPWDGHTPDGTIQRLKDFAVGPDFRSVYTLGELCEIKALLGRAADFAWDDQRPIIGRSLDRILNKLDAII